ncbi:MAG TPA: hypothetical protein VL863_04770, partial [bacterium]|nr:hypothetical protein [bacterium]
VLVADCIISQGVSQPGYLNPGNNYSDIGGPGVSGFHQNGAFYNHLSAHLKNNMPMGGNIGYKDGHVAWRKFKTSSSEYMTPRTTAGINFWW